ncbi:MAG TPA: lantibiotic dehydratase [Kofleriaceae bacterium]
MSGRFELASGWASWRWVWLRGAGFSAGFVRALGSSALVAAMDAWLAAEVAADQARAAASHACNEAWVTAAHDEALRHARNRLRKGRAPSEPVGIAAVDGPVERFREALAAREQQQQAAEHQLAHEQARTLALVERLAVEPRFREAVCWQNPDVLHHCLDKLSHGGASERHRRVRTAIKYIQRYSVKNDTIGFFGPVAWGQIAPAGAGVVVDPGRELVEYRRVYFERWPIEILAEQAAHDPAARDVLRPRRKLFSWVADDALLVPSATPRAVTALEGYLLRHADGGLSVRQLTDQAVAAPEAGHPDRAAVGAAIEALTAERALELSLHLPAEVLEVETWLRAALGEIADPEARARLLAPLDRLEARRDQLARAAGDPAALDHAIGELEREFSAITQGLSAKRGHGRMYAGRQLFFEDCRRALRFEVGGELLRALTPPLALLFDSARWFTWEIAQGYRRELAALHRQLVERSGQAQVPLGALLAGARDLFTGKAQVASPVVLRAQQALQQRWLEVLDLPPDALEQRSIELSSEACAARARPRFAAPGPGWPRARHHSPDIMIAARSAEHAARGDSLCVLGELHVATNTLLMAHAVAMHPERAVLVDDWVIDMADAMVSPVQASADRASFVTPSPRDTHVELGHAASWRDRDRVLHGGDLYCEQVGDQLQIRSRRGGVELDLIAFMDHYLSAAAASHYRLLPRRPHWPRITLDRLVVSRERWHQTKREFWELIASEVTPYETVYRWAQQLGLPRFVFATVVPEAKPIYVDFGSPVQVEIFLGYLRHADELGLSEMLPGHDELWLTDPDGERYTCELRLAATDPVAWSPAPIG